MFGLGGALDWPEAERKRFGFFRAPEDAFFARLEGVLPRAAKHEWQYVNAAGFLEAETREVADHGYQTKVGGYQKSTRKR